MRNTASGSMSPDEAAKISYQMQEWGNFWHTYLFARFRLQEIAEHGLGVATDNSQESTEE